MREMNFHIVGVGGAGMSAIAQLLVAEGHEVSGSDTTDEWPLARVAARAGVLVSAPFDARHVEGSDVVIRSSAYGDDHVEVKAAREAGISVWRRHDAWRFLARGKMVVAIAGTHGKTTATALVFTALRGGGRDPSLICGAELSDLGTNAHAGSDPILVIEADEYDRTFHALEPNVAVVTNVDHDHVDQFPTREDVVDAFREFVSRVAPGGTVIACADDSGARVVATWSRHHMGWSTQTYGVQSDADWRISQVTHDAAGVRFHLLTPTSESLVVRLCLLGEHNALNAAAAVAAAAACGVPPAVATSTLRSFRGTSRRLELLGEARGIAVIDDYAHHPVEIRASIAAVRPRVERRLVALFQPHTPSRLRAFFPEFAAALRGADAAIVVETFASARERADDRGGARALAAEVAGSYAATNDEAARGAASLAQAGDTVLVMGAGDVREAGKRLLELLR